MMFSDNLHLWTQELYLPWCRGRLHSSATHRASEPSRPERTHQGAVDTEHKTHTQTHLKPTNISNLTWSHPPCHQGLTILTVSIIGEDLAALSLAASMALWRGRERQRERNLWSNMYITIKWRSRGGLGLPFPAPWLWDWGSWGPGAPECSGPPAGPGSAGQREALVWHQLFYWSSPGSGYCTSNHSRRHHHHHPHHHPDHHYHHHTKIWWFHLYLKAKYETPSPF